MVILKMNSISKKHVPTLIFLICVVIVSLLVGILSRPYFTEPIFYVDQHKYTYDHEQGNQITYRSGTAAPIQVTGDHQKHTVIIDNENYIITRISSTPNATYNVFYADGRKYTVEQQSEQLISYDAQGNMLSPVNMYIDGQSVIEDHEEHYNPATLVTVAYPEYHHTPGTPILLFIALAGLIYGWCSFYYPRFQKFQFLLSLRWIWSKDPEPSEFYYAMSKIGGIACMIVAIWGAFQAF